MRIAWHRGAHRLPPRRRTVRRAASRVLRSSTDSRHPAMQTAAPLGRPDHYRPRGKTTAEVTRGQVYFGQRGPQRRLGAVTTAVQRANANPSLRGESAQRVPDAGSGRGDGWRSTAVRDALDLCLGPAARAVRRIARPTSTWQHTKPNSSPITTPDDCAREATTRSAGYPCWRPPYVAAGLQPSSTRSPTRRCCRAC